MSAKKELPTKSLGKAKSRQNMNSGNTRVEFELSNEELDGISGGNCGATGGQRCQSSAQVK